MCLLVRGIWASISDLLGDLSAFSSYEDALAEAVYEELDYLVSQKEGLLESPGGCTLLGPLVVTSHWLCASSQHLQPPGVPQTHRVSSSKVIGWPVRALKAPSLCIHCMNQACSFSTLTLVPWLWEGSFCVLCDVCLHIRLPVRW